MDAVQCWLVIYLYAAQPVLCAQARQSFSWHHLHSFLVSSFMLAVIIYSDIGGKMYALIV